jgi:hypothetical protein
VRLLGRLFNRTIVRGAETYKFSWPEIFLVIAVFTKEIGSRNDYGIDFDFIGYPFFIIYFFTHIEQIIKYKAAPIRLFFYFILSSLISILWLNITLNGFFKQIIPIVIILTVSFTILKYRNIYHVFELYVKFTFWTAVFGIIQVIFSYAGIFLLTTTVGRLDSIAYEPSHYAALLMPALVYTFLNFKRFKLYFFVMLGALLLTYNLTCYIVFLGILTFASFHPIYVMMTVPLAYYVFFNVLPSFSQNFAIRFSDTYSSLSGSKDILSSNLQVNGTTLSFFSNFDVAKYTLSNSPLTGSGLGGHEEMYARHFANSSFTANYYYGLNAKSAHSLGIRILSEFGLIGAGMYVYFLVKNLIFSKGAYYAIGLSCVSHFLCKLFKLGGYIDYGTPFFFTIMILNARAYRAFNPQKSIRAKRQNGPFPVHQAS